jgi:hypothetical protein
LAKEGMRCFNVFFRGAKIFFTGGREGGEEKIFFWDRGFFFYREAVSKFFLGAKDFFTGRGGGFESRLCLRLGGKGKEDKNFFWTEDLFLQGGKEGSKVVFA